jgi:hypothetical protein
MLKYCLCLLLLFTVILPVKAQQKAKDSAEVANTLKTLLSICRNINFADPKTKDSGTFYKAAQYIVYRGEDKNRAWKDFAVYQDPEEKKGVDGICYKINSSVNQDSNYRIAKYITEKESEGTWHILLVSYRKKGVEKKAAYAFLKIRGRFGLGDID